MLFHRNPKRALWVVASVVLLLAVTLAPAALAADDRSQEVVMEADSSFLTALLNRVREIFGSPVAFDASGSDPREDDREDEDEDEGDDPDDPGGGILAPGATMDPGGGRRW